MKTNFVKLSISKQKNFDQLVLLDNSDQILLTSGICYKKIYVHTFDVANFLLLIFSQIRICPIANIFCLTYRHVLGKMTKPNMWSRVLEDWEVIIISTACGLVNSGDVILSVKSSKFVEKIIVSNGECTSAEGTNIIIDASPVSLYSFDYILV